eukprot:gene14512-biopygen11157
MHATWRAPLRTWPGEAAGACATPRHFTSHPSQPPGACLAGARRPLRVPACCCVQRCKKILLEKTGKCIGLASNGGGRAARGTDLRAGRRPGNTCKFATPPPPSTAPPIRPSTGPRRPNPAR